MGTLIFVGVLMFFVYITDFDDLSQFYQEFFNVKYGLLTRGQYVCCVSIWTGVLVIITIAVSFWAGFTLKGFLSTWTGPIFFYFFYAIVCASAFMRRMNDACLSRWFTLVFLIPGIGGVVAFIMAAFIPSDYGSPYYKDKRI